MKKLAVVIALVPSLCVGHQDHDLIGTNFQQLDQDYCEQETHHLNPLWESNYMYGPVRMRIIKDSMQRIADMLEDIDTELDLIDWMLGGDHYYD